MHHMEHIAAVIVKGGATTCSLPNAYAAITSPRKAARKKKTVNRQ